VDTKLSKQKAERANIEELAQILGVGLSGDNPSADDVEKVRAILAANPGEYRSFGELASKALESVVECATTWVVQRETVKERMQKLQDDLGYASSNIVEQMAITQVVLNWARLYFLETNLSNATRESHRPESAHYWDRASRWRRGDICKP
jgi:hypothetical protein